MDFGHGILSWKGKLLNLETFRVSGIFWTLDFRPKRWVRSEYQKDSANMMIDELSYNNCQLFQNYSRNHGNDDHNY